MIAAKKMLLAGGGMAQETRALLARMQTQPPKEQVTRINDLIVGLKRAGIWSRLDIFYMLAAHDMQAALLNWKRSDFNLTTQEFVNFEAYSGVTLGPRGKTRSLTSQFRVGLEGVISSLASHCIYSLVAASGGGPKIACNSTVGNSNVTSGSVGFDYNSATTDCYSAGNSIRGPNSGLRALYGLSRQDNILLRQSSDGAPSSIVQAPNSMGNDVFYMHNTNADVTHRFAMAGASLTVEQMVSARQNIIKYLNAVGVTVP